MKYLEKRIDQPLAWANVFGGALALAGALIGYAEGQSLGAVVGGVFGLSLGLKFGWVLGGFVWLVCAALGGLDRPVRRPDRWGVNLHCTKCGWRTTPDGPWTLRDCLNWMDKDCPCCSTIVVHTLPTCPHCEETVVQFQNPVRDLLAVFRSPRPLRHLFCGHFTCQHCGRILDKWGREIASGQEDPNR